MRIASVLKAFIVLLLPRAANALFFGFFLELLCNIPIIRLLLNCNDVEDPLGLKPTIYSNAFDGRVFSLEYNGTKATLFGSLSKEVDLPLSMLTESPDGNITMFTFPENGTAINMVVTDNTSSLGIFEFKPGPNNTMRVQFSLPGDSYRGFVVLNPTANASNRLLSSPHDDLEKGTKRHSRTRTSENQNVVPIKGVHENSLSQLGPVQEKAIKVLQQPQKVVRFTQGSNAGSVSIFVIECLSSVDPTSLSVTAVSDGKSVPVSVQRNDKGSYTAFFAVQEAEPISEAVLDAVCGVISGVGQLCPIVEALGPSSVVFGGAACAALSTALLATAAGAPFAPVVLRLCVAGIGGFVAFCEAHNLAGGGLPPGSPNALEAACEALADGSGFVEDLYFLEEVTVTATAQLPSGESVSGTSTFTPESGSVGPPIELEGDGKPQLINFEAIPPDPVAFQGYLAFAEVICAGDETVVEMAIEGTDGYRNNVVCSGSCSLNVPGAEQGVVDTITVKITDPSLPFAGIFEVIGLFFR